MFITIKTGKVTAYKFTKAFLDILIILLSCCRKPVYQFGLKTSISALLFHYLDASLSFLSGGCSPSMPFICVENCSHSYYFSSLPPKVEFSNQAKFVSQRALRAVADSMLQTN